MTQEDKLLYKTLCAILPYGVKVEIDGYGTHVLKGIDGNTISTDRGINYPLRLVKPYLRPMSSMTSKEWVEFCDCSLKDEMSWVWTGNRQKFVPVQNKEDYLNSKYFDCRGLIPMDLALEAPDGMYKSK